MNLLWSSCSTVFSIAGCPNKFAVGDTVNLHAVGIDQPVMVSARGANWFSLTALSGHVEGAGRRIRFTIRQFNGSSYLVVEAHGPGSVLTTDDILARMNERLARHFWQQLANNLTQTMTWSRRMVVK
jgi:hypothetical protein